MAKDSIPEKVVQDIRRKTRRLLENAPNGLIRSDDAHVGLNAAVSESVALRIDQPDDEDDDDDEELGPADPGEHGYPFTPLVRPVCPADR